MKATNCNYYTFNREIFAEQLLSKDADLRLKDVELMNLRRQFGNSLGDLSKLPSTGDNRGSVYIFI